MLYAFTKTTRNTLKYHLVTAEPPSTVKTIGWMHQTGPRILQSVTYMLYINQVCHGVGRCVKDGICSSSSLSESQWTVLIVNGISYYINKCRHYQTHHIWQFLTIFLSVRLHCACNTVQLLQRSRLIQHLREKCDFRVSPFCQVVQKHKLWEVLYYSIFWLPTVSVTFLPKISKSVHVCQGYTKPWDVFETRCIKVMKSI